MNVTPAERRVLDLLVEGRTNKEIASALWLTTETIKFHVTNLLRKNGARNRAHLAAMAIREERAAL